VDDGVASMLAALEKAGLDQNTVIVFMSDNGLISATIVLA